MIGKREKMGNIQQVQEGLVLLGILFHLSSQEIQEHLTNTATCQLCEGRQYTKNVCVDAILRTAIYGDNSVMRISTELTYRVNCVDNGLPGSPGAPGGPTGPGTGLPPPKQLTHVSPFSP